MFNFLTSKKMKKYYFLAAGLLLMLGSCSQDDIVEANLGADEIRFAAVTNGATRAADIYNPTDMPASFQVSAMSQNKVYISDDKIEKQGSSWVNTTGTRYWPEDAVDFYAHVNAGETIFQLNNGAPTFNNFSVASDVGNQVDLLYAVKKGQTKNETPVTLNFRHALSQIVFKARNESENIFVQIQGVKVMNVEGSGTYTFPTASTDPNLPTAGSTNSNNRGKWALTDTKADYEVNFSLVDVKGSKTNPTTVNLSDVEGTALMLMPQTTTAWDPETDPKPSVGNTNSYLLVDCVIYNVADGSATTLPGDNVCLWGKEEKGSYTTKELAIPVKFAWEEGKKYTYTLVFGNGNGGYNPDPEDPDPENPEPVLVPISFEVTVDEFLDGGSYDVESPNNQGTLADDDEEEGA